MNDDCSVEIDPAKHPHLDHGYAVTSHSSQGQTADRVLIHVDTELGAKDLFNNRMAYVAISRGAHDAQLFTNDSGWLRRGTWAGCVAQECLYVEAGAAGGACAGTAGALLRISLGL